MQLGELVTVTGFELLKQVSSSETPRKHYLNIVTAKKSTKKIIKMLKNPMKIVPYQRIASFLHILRLMLAVWLSLLL